MYKYTRQEAADFLNISTRSVDRYVKSGKIRSQKKGKIVYLNTNDVENLSPDNIGKQEIIVEKKTTFSTEPLKKQETSLSTEKPSIQLGKIYEDLRSEIKEKDMLITELSLRVGQAEEVVKNSVSLIDYKKSQLLLEESKTNLNQAIIDLESEKEDLQKELKYQKTNNIIMLLAMVVLFTIAGALFLLKI